MDRRRHVTGPSSINVAHMSRPLGQGARKHDNVKYDLGTSEKWEAKAVATDAAGVRGLVLTATGERPLDQTRK